jgi:hypothetical protein
MGDFAEKKMQWCYLDRLQLYLPLLSKVMSPFLLLVYIGSMIMTKRSIHAALLPITLSALGGLGLMLAWPGNAVDQRYLAPALIIAAIYSGFFLSELFYADNKAKRIAAALLLILTSLQYLYCNFVPYPISLPKSQNLANYLPSNNPTPLADWGHTLVIDTIKNTEGVRVVYLNVLTNLGSLHTHAFELLLKERGNHTIIPTTSRVFTVFGDKVQFKEEDALQPQWYLWKTGSVGYMFFDKKSEANFNQLVDFIRNSGNFKLMAERTLPDNSELMLYRKNNEPN